MRPAHLQQVARVAIVVPPNARLASVGALLDAFEMTRAHIRQQYGAIDILPAADRFDVSDVHLHSIDGKQVRTLGGAPIAVQAIVPAQTFDIIAIADFAHVAGEPLRASGSPAFESWLRSQHESGAIVAACGASVAHVLGSGVAVGRRLAVAPWLAADLLKSWPVAEVDLQAGVVEDGQILSGRGGVADHAVAHRLVEAVTSTNIARWLAARLGIVRDQATADPGPQATLLAQAQEWLANRFSQPVRIAELAEELGVDRRTLHRHFVRGTGRSPIEYLQSLRIEAAKSMLQRSAFRIERIAALVGYSDMTHFRAAFRQSTGTSPRQWRKINAPSRL